MAWFRYCDCQVWVKAEPCAGVPDAPVLVMHEDDLPATTRVFKVNGECYSVDPSANRICRPKGSLRIHPYTDGYATCTECEEAEDEEGSSGVGSGDVPPSPWYGAGGWGGGWRWDGDGDTPKGLPATPCSGHATRATERGWPLGQVYYERADELESSIVVSAGGICWSVSAGVPQEPVNATSIWWIRGGTRFDTCTDCTHGYKASLCPDDAAATDADDAPEIWIRARDMDAAPDAFDRGRWCYQKPIGELTIIPENAIIWRPQGELTCEYCELGVQYQICEGHAADDRQWWAPADEAAALIEDDCPDIIYMKIHGRCYSLDLTATPSRIPRDANKVSPRRVYASCEACICTREIDECAEDTQGVQVRICPGQVTGSWRAPYVRAENLPPVLTHFEFERICVYVDPLDPLVTIPPDAAIVTEITNVFDSCEECLYDGSKEGWPVWSGEPPWWRPAPDPSEPVTPPPIPPSPLLRYYPLITCDDPPESTNYVLHAPFLNLSMSGDYRGKMVEVKLPGQEPQCFELAAPLATAPGRVIVNGLIYRKELFDSCDECDDDGSDVPCTDCHGEQPSAYVTITACDHPGCESATGEYEYSSFKRLDGGACQWTFAGPSEGGTNWELWLIYSPDGWGVYLTDRLYFRIFRYPYSTEPVLTCNKGSGIITGTINAPGMDGVYDCRGCLASIIFGGNPLP